MKHYFMFVYMVYSLGMDVKKDWYACLGDLFHLI